MENMITSRLSGEIRKYSPRIFDGLDEQMLHFLYMDGSISPVVSGEVVSWRISPYANIAHISNGQWKVEWGDRPPTIINGGEACCIPAGVRHRSIMISEGVSESRWAHFNILLCGYIDILSLIDMPEVFRDATAQRLGEILSELAQLGEETNLIFSLLNRKVLEFELATILVRESKPKYQSHLRLQQLKRVLPALDVINKNLDHTLTRDKLAKACHLSSSRFGTVFREALGVSPIDYIVKLRMQLAQQLLTNESLSVEQVAVQVGYDDPFYFSRLFKTHYGLSPKKYQIGYLKTKV